MKGNEAEVRVLERGGERSGGGRAEVYEDEILMKKV